MSVHSCSRCWVHLIWATLNRERVLNKRAAASVSCFLEEYADKKGHLPQSKLCECRSVHALIDLPTAFSIEKVVQLLKGSSSHWINSNHIIAGKFAWGRGYGAFSISHSNVDVLMRYIADQEEHHRQRTFTEEWREFIDRHGLRWRDEERR